MQKMHEAIFDATGPLDLQFLHFMHFCIETPSNSCHLMLENPAFCVKESEFLGACVNSWEPVRFLLQNQIETQITTANMR